MVKHKARKQRQGYHQLVCIHHFKSFRGKLLLDAIDCLQLIVTRQVLEKEKELEAKQGKKRQANKERTEREMLDKAGQGGSVGALNSVTLKGGSKFSFDMGKTLGTHSWASHAKYTQVPRPGNLLTVASCGRWCFCQADDGRSRSGRK